MPYSQQDALAALNAVECAQRRATIFRGYEKGAPYFFLWGIIWIIGYTGSEFYRQYAGTVWLILNLIGITAGFFIQKTCQSAQAREHASVRYIGATISAGIFMAATYFVLTPSHGQQFDAFPALLVAFIYTLVGLWRGIRFTIAGVLLTALTILGYAILREHFALWMAVVGGVTLLTTGFWLRHS